MSRRVLLGAGVVASARVLAGAVETSVAFTSVAATTASAAQPSGSAPAFVPDAASRVNLFVGTTNGGHVFPGMFPLLEFTFKRLLVRSDQGRRFRTGW